MSSIISLFASKSESPVECGCSRGYLAPAAGRGRNQANSNGFRAWRAVILRCPGDTNIADRRLHDGAIAVPQHEPATLPLADRLAEFRDSMR